MILPVTAYGHPILRKVAVEIDRGYPQLNQLIADMFETMYASSGVGLAAPQINKSIRLIVIDASPFAEEYPETKDFKRVFINPRIIDETGDEWPFTEGCLSIPDVREEVERKPKIKISYYDENWDFHEEVFDSIMARILQHEYDHLEGKLFVDHVSSIRKMLLKRKLADISKGNISVDYKMIFPNKKKGRK